MTLRLRLVILLIACAVATPIARADPPGAYWFAPEAPPREGQAAVCDTRRNRMIVFGGYDRGSLYNDVWVTPLTGATEWQPLYIAGTQPSARSGATAVYDSALDRVVMFGGWTGSTFPGYAYDVWSLALTGAPRWTRIVPSGTPPSGRMFPASAFDRAGNRIFVYGGFSDVGPFPDVWQLALDATPAWTQIRPPDPLPAARGGAGMIFDPERNRLVVAGGAPFQGAGPGDTWQLSLDGAPRWSLLVPSGAVPSQVYGNPAVYDPVRRQMILFDFFRGVTLPLDEAAPEWANLPHQSFGDPIPRLRSAHGLVFDPESERMILHGGYVDAPYNDTWAYALDGGPEAGQDSASAGWTQLAPLGDHAPARAFHTCVRDPARDRLVIYGGTDGGERHDLWTYSLAAGAWEPLSATGTAPRAFRGLSCIHDPPRDRLIFFGGEGGQGVSNEVWSLSLAGTPEWSLITTVGDTISPRRDHSAVYDRTSDRMLVYGGLDSTGARLGDVWQLSLGAAPAWRRVAVHNTAPPPRAGHGAVWDDPRARMMIFGGNAPTPVRDVFIFNPVSGQWFNASASTRLDPRAYAVAVLDSTDGLLIVTGGTGSPDAWALDLVGTLGWTQISVAGPAPHPASGAGGVFDPVRKRIVEFGGVDTDYQYLAAVTELVLSPHRPLIVRAGGPYAGRVGKAIAFDTHRCYDFENNPLSFGWDFGDGQSATGATASHAYANEGTFVLRLTGSDRVSQVTDSAEVIVHAAVPTLLALFGAGTLPEGIEIRWRFSELDPGAEVRLERASSEHGPWNAPAVELREDGEVTVALDRTVESGATYWYRLAVRTPGGAVGTFGPRSVTAGTGGLDFALGRIDPNPSVGLTRIDYRLARAAHLRLSVFDVAGREIAVLVDRMHPAGSYQVTWDDRGDRGAVPPGIYLVRYRVPSVDRSRRIVRVR